MGGLKIDFTLVVQAINFAIAYIAIRTLLLKPAIKMLQENAAYDRALTHKIEVATLANSAQEERMREQWQHYRETVKEKVPGVVFEPLPIMKNVPEEPVSTSVNKEYAQYLVTALSEELVERMEHVHQ